MHWLVAIAIHPAYIDTCLTQLCASRALQMGFAFFFRDVSWSFYRTAASKGPATAKRLVFPTLCNAYLPSLLAGRTFHLEAVFTPKTHGVRTWFHLGFREAFPKGIRFLGWLVLRTGEKGRDSKWPEMARGRNQSSPRSIPKPRKPLWNPEPLLTPEVHQPNTSLIRLCFMFNLDICLKYRQSFFVPVRRGWKASKGRPSRISRPEWETSRRALAWENCWSWCDLWD